MPTIRCTGLLGAALCLLALACPHADAREAGVLARRVDAVVVAGSTVPTLLGTRPESFAVLAALGGELVPIPFQVDEKTRAGAWVVPIGSAAATDEDATFDANDELVFMAADAGPRWEGSLPPAARVAEVAVTDPVDGASAFVYVLTGLTDPPRSEVDYVEFDDARGEVRARDYVMGYDPRAPISIGRLLVRRALGGSGLSIADRMKIRFHAKVFGLFAIDRTEEDFRVRQIGLKDGPVRVIRRTLNWTNLFWRIPSPKLDVATLFYGTKMVFPIAFEVPFDVNAILAEPYVRLTTDSLCARPGRRYHNAHNPDGVPVDGAMSVAERALDRRQYSWSLVAGTLPAEPGAWMSRFVFNRTDFPATYHLYYLDDMTTPDPPENEAGSCGNIGYEFDGVPYVRKGVLRLTTYMYPLGGLYRPGDERPVLDDLDRPLVVTSRRAR